MGKMSGDREIVCVSVYVCMCVFVCVRERERGRKKGEIAANAVLYPINSFLFLPILQSLKNRKAPFKQRSYQYLKQIFYHTPHLYYVLPMISWQLLVFLLYGDARSSIFSCLAPFSSKCLMLRGRKNI